MERAGIGAGPASEHGSSTRRGTGHRRGRWSSRVVSLALLACAATFLGVLVAPTAEAAPRRPADNTYDLPESGVFLEGIGVDRRAGWIYVSATNRSGTIYRGRVGSGRLETWQPPHDGNDGRGIDVDRAGRVFVAGGPSGEVRVFSRNGALLAELPTNEQGSFLNDVWVAPDGAAYVTDSSLPIIWRVRQQHGRFRIERWLDVSRTITYTPNRSDFDLGGIVSTPGGRYLLTAQGTTGQLWRIDLRSKRIREVPISGGPVVNADGLVLQGHNLTVVQNFSRQVSRLRLDDRWQSATTRKVIPTDTDRTFTTAKLVRGQLLLVDSKFGFPPTAAVAQSRVVPLSVAAR